MPVYEYMCQSCGVFEEMRPMSLFSAPCDCPDCGAASKRVLLTVPNISGISTHIRKAHETNERSADSPKRSNHGPNCGCCGGGSKKNSKTLLRPDGSKSFPSKRPWMISH